MAPAEEKTRKINRMTSTAAVLADPNKRGVRVRWRLRLFFSFFKEVCGVRVCGFYCYRPSNVELIVLFSEQARIQFARMERSGFLSISVNVNFGKSK